jgi:hypothetical protein
MANVKIYKVGKDGKILRGSIDESRLREAVIAGWKQGEPAAAPAAPTAPAAVAPLSAPAAMPTEAAVPEDETTLSGALGGFARGAAPYALGGAIGAAAGGIPTGGIGAAPGAALGVGATALASLISEVITPLLNSATGTNQKTLNQVVESILTEAGVAEPKTAAERMVQTVTSGAYGGAGMGAAGQVFRSTQSFAAPTVKELALRSLTAGGVEAGAATGAAAGLGSQAVAEMGGGPTAQMLAGMGAGMVAGRPFGAPIEPGSVPMSRLEPPSGVVPLAQKYAQEAADRALLARGGPELAAKLEKGTLRTSPQEAARVMRETGMTKTWTPAGLAEKAGAVKAESGDLLGRIRAEVDRQASALQERSAASRTAGEAKKTELTAKYADKVKAAEAAAKNAAEIEAAANKAATDFEAQKEALLKASSETKPLPEGDVAQLPIRSTVAARKSLDVKQREIAMMKAAAKKARADADRLAKEAAPSSYEHAQSQMDIIEAERLAGEAGKRMISGKQMAQILRDEAAGLGAPGKGPESISGEKNRGIYRALIKEAKALENSGDMTLETANEKINRLRNTAAWERSPDASVQASAEAAKSSTRALSEGELGAVSSAEVTPDLSTVLSARLARLGRGKTVAGAPTPEEGLRSLKRAYEVSLPLEESAKEEAARVAKLGWAPELTLKEGKIGGSLLPPAVTQRFVPSIKSKLLEAATSTLGAPSAGYEMSMLDNAPAAYLAALSAIDQSLNPENPEEQQSMVTP